MKKIATLVIVIILLVVISIFFLVVKNQKKGEIYEKYEIYKEFYGKKLYVEIDYKSTQYEKKVGTEIAERMENVLEYVGDESNANTDVGALQRYYWFPFHKKPSSCKCEVNLLTTKLDGDTGHVWVSYWVTRLDENDEVINFTGDGPALLYIKKEGSSWIVADIDEPA